MLSWSLPKNERWGNQGRHNLLLRVPCSELLKSTKIVQEGLPYKAA